jgi:DNA-binding winged helix-turn-helix (wHTH) protein
MFLSFKKILRPCGLLLGVVSLLALQALWLYNAYQLTYDNFVTTVHEAFDNAYRKEQTYRIPVTDIINPGALTIQSCGNEEIRIIRKCPAPDTVVFDNVSGQSLETFISRAFYELRESITPLNIYCLSDLFAGELYDRGLPLAFSIERFDNATGKLVETTTHLQNGTPEHFSAQVTVRNATADGLQATLQFRKAVIFGQMTGTLIVSLCLLLLTGGCFAVLFRSSRHRKNLVPAAPPAVSNGASGKTFPIGNYCFNSEKNELQGFGEIVHLNKKENAILLALCMERGNVVDRAVLLEEQWGSAGIIYSRSLDTYITRLRKYLKDDPSVQIVAVKGQGYKLMENGEVV